MMILKIWMQEVAKYLKIPLYHVHIFSMYGKSEIKTKIKIVILLNLMEMNDILFSS